MPDVRKKIWDSLTRSGPDYGASPYADPRKPFLKPYNDMSRLERRIDRRIRLASWLAVLAGFGFGALLVYLVRTLSR